jgi:hypothetical protein
VVVAVLAVYGEGGDHAAASVLLGHRAEMFSRAVDG